MCHIYNAECSVCNKIIDMHLGDYLTDESEVEVFCSEHIPDTNVVVWKGKDCWYSKTRQEYLMCGNSIKVGVRLLTDNARKHKDMNHPNLFKCDIVEDEFK